MLRVIGTAGLAIAVLAASTASAEGAPRKSGARLVSSAADGSSAVITALPRTPKDQYEPDVLAEQIGAYSRFRAQHDGAHPFSAYNSIYACPNSCGDVTANLSVTVDVNNSCCVPVNAIFNNGHSWGRWLGSNPFNATSMTLADTYKAEGVSVTVSYPAGAGFSGSGDTVTWSGSVSNTWTIDHYYNGIHFSTGWWFSGFRQSTRTDAQFGSSFYSTTANGSTSQ